MLLQPSDTDVLLLCGGLGSRLRAALPDSPKALAPVGGKPFLAWMLEYLTRQRCRRVILCAGVMFEAIEEFCLTADYPLELVMSVESKSLGTAGALKQAEQHLQSDHFLLLNGDSLCPIKLDELTAQHQRTGATATVAVTFIDDIAQYGSVTLTDHGNVERFEEKSGVTRAGYVNAGIYAISKRVLATLPPGQPRSLERDVLPALATEELSAFVTRLPLIDIGTPERLAAAQLSLQASMSG